MSASGRSISRFFPKVQRLITEWCIGEFIFTTRRLQEAVFGDTYDPDSRLQDAVIRGCIERGRRHAIQLWIAYLTDGTFVQDGEELRYYHPERIEDAKDHDDFLDFAHELNRGKFGKDITEIRANLDDYALTACLFWDRLVEFGAAGNNLLIATYGKESSWFRPTFWRWCIRDCALYRRTIKTLHRQLERGRATRLLLPSGESIDKVLGLAGATRAMLEDGTAWSCPRCGLRNPASHEGCANCGAPRSPLPAA